MFVGLGTSPYVAPSGYDMMTTTEAIKRGLAKTFERHSQFVQACLCMVEGCTLPLQVSKPHAWTCSTHDPLTAKKRPPAERKQ